MQGLASNKQTNNIIQSRQCRGWHQTNIQHHSVAASAGAGIKQTSFRAAIARAGIKETSFRAASAGTGIKQSVDIIQSCQCSDWHQTNRHYHSEPSEQSLDSNKQPTSFSSRQCRGWHQANIIQSRQCRGWHQANIIQSRQCRGWHQSNIIQSRQCTAWHNTISRHHS